MSSKNILSLSHFLRTIKTVTIFIILTSFFCQPLMVLAESSPWTREKAEHLARRALLDPTPTDIELLFSASSAQAAADILLAEPNADQLSVYNSDLAQFAVRNNSNETNSAYMQKLYLYKLMRDPARAKRKLWLLWEDTFSVDAQSGSTTKIRYQDASALHNFLYQNTFGDYREMVKAMQDNYAMATYLDLIDSNKKYPNQNFARELLQLFLMGEDRLFSTQKNYTESDVASLSYILTGYTLASGTREVIFDPSRHSTTSRSFLGGTRSEAIGVVDYIFDKRDEAISEFVAAKLLRYYVRDDFSQSELLSLASELRANNYNLRQTMSWLFSSDLFYSNQAMNSYRYKNPVELIVGAYRLLQQNSPEKIVDPTGVWISDLNFTPYYPGSIFGRDGYDDNSAWFNAYITNRWLSLSARMAYEASPMSGRWSATDLVSWTATASSSEDKLPEDLIDDLEKSLLLGRSLASETRIVLRDYLTKNAGGDIVFNPSNLNYQRSKIYGAVAFIMAQPEFILQSGHLTAGQSMDLSTSQSNVPDAPDLYLIKLGGGLDYMSLMAPISDSAYQSFRGPLALGSSERIDLNNGYALNKSFEKIYPYYQSGEASFLNSVGMPGQSFGHDTASVQFETGNEQHPGAIGKAFSALDNTEVDLVSLTNNQRAVFDGNKSLIIGSASMLLQNQAYASTTEKDFYFSSLISSLSAHPLPGQSAIIFGGALRLNNTAKNNLASGKSPSAGYNLESRLNFADSMRDEGLGKVFYANADGGYDTHSDQEIGLNNNLSRLASTTAAFYEKQKSKGRHLSIVLFSEFGRTNKVNSSLGTDHGLGGGVVVLSNVLDWPSMMGKMEPSRDRGNYLSPRIDTRAMWGSLLQTHFGFAPANLYGDNYILDNYADNLKPDISHFRQSTTTANSVSYEFESDDLNFDLRYGLSTSTVSLQASGEGNPRTISVSQSGLNLFRFSLSSLIPGKKYEAILSNVDSNGQSSSYTWSFWTPVYLSKSSPFLSASTTQSNLFIEKTSLTIDGYSSLSGFLLTATSSESLWSLPDMPSYSLLVASSTSLFSASSSHLTLWNGFILAPQSNEIQRLSQDGVSLDFASFTHKQALAYWRAGAPQAGLVLSLDKEATLSMPVPSGHNLVHVMSSNDGLKWKIHQANVPVSNDLVKIGIKDLIHYAVFAINDSSSSGNISSSQGSGSSTSGGSSSSQISSGAPVIPEPFILPLFTYSTSHVNRIIPELIIKTKLDSDDDGLSDDFEKAVGTDPFNPDTDEDTYSDGKELFFAYDPLSRNSHRLVKDEKFTKSLAGSILLQVEGQGEAWYVNPLDLKRYYLGRPDDAFSVMRQHGLGAKHKDIASFLVNRAPRSLYGRILIDVEDSGKAYYVDYQNGSLDYLGRPADAFSVMRKHGLGIKNNNLSRIIISVNTNE